MQYSEYKRIKRLGNISASIVTLLSIALLCSLPLIPSLGMSQKRIVAGGGITLDILAIYCISRLEKLAKAPR